MSYPTNENSRWEPPRHHKDTMVLAPRRRVIVREAEGDFKEPPPLGRWRQASLCPCKNFPIMCYSLCCCCCAMGDIGCYIRENWMCYPVYCLCAACPCCVGELRELVAEKYDLPISSWEPEDCGWCLVKFIGMRLACFASVCLLPCFHVAQMRAEVAYRRHGKTTVFPCCCCWCGGGDGPGGITEEDEELDYPREGEQKRPDLATVANKEEDALDYPRASAQKAENRPASPPKEALDYPRASARQAENRPASPREEVIDYPRASSRAYEEQEPENVKIVLDYPRAGR